MLLRVIIVWLTATTLSLHSQVISMTLGIDVNSPYGLSEPWFTIRNALLRADALQSVAERPDVKTATAEATPKGGELPDLPKLQKTIRESGAGATLRGVEATLEGDLISNQGKFFLRMPGKEVPLLPLTELVQHERKRPKRPSAEELDAHVRFVREANHEKRWRVTGPLRWRSEVALEVRVFEPVKNKSQGKL